MSTRKRRGASGFTLIELAIVVAIMLLLTTLAYPLITRTKPRAQLAGLGTELHALMHRARQEAMARGKWGTAVLFYPAAPYSSGVGRIILVADENGTFMNCTATAPTPDYCTLTLTPGLPAPGALDEIDLPLGFRLSIPASTLAFPFPYNNVPAAPANGCSFCTGTPLRGAVRFDSRGRVSFYDNAGPIAATNGGSVSITSADLSGSRVLTILPPPYGGIRTFSKE